MHFNSLEFVIFFSIVFFLYWFVFNKNLQLQNFLLLASSYVFYGSWDYRFLLLLFFSTLVTFTAGLKIHKSERPRIASAWLLSSVIVSLGTLGIFKYFNFFMASLADGASLFGLQVNTWSLSMILPLGISFYTFHGLSYVFDVYRKKTIPTSSFIDYGVFIGFFPLLVAGPIERATHLLPQIKKVRRFNFEKSADGLRQILWGLFKKIVIADNCAVHVDSIFGAPESYSSSTLAFGAFLFAFQIYCDFSGYSDMAIGLSKLLGFDILRNFSFPYFSRDIAEFWRRWHTSLTTWLRDYLYIPFGGSRGNRLNTIRNIFVVFLASALWHGANWTFLVWGLLHAIYYLPLMISNRNRRHLDVPAQGRIFPTVREFIQILTTFILTTFAWIFFRAPDVDHAIDFIARLFSGPLATFPQQGFLLLPLIVIMFIAEWIQRDKQHALELSNALTPVFRWGVYTILVLFIFCFGADPQRFIYFQF